MATAVYLFAAPPIWYHNNGTAGGLPRCRVLSCGKTHKRARVHMGVRLGPGSESSSADILISSEIGIGTIAWGDESRGYGTNFQKRDIDNAVKYLIENGVNFFDTAEVYGYRSSRKGESSEHLLGDAIRPLPRNDVLISSKFFPVLWTNALLGGGFRIGKQAVLNALRASLTRLGVGVIDLYVIHFPFPYFGGINAIVDGFAEAYQLGLVRAVGVSNYTQPKELRKIHSAFTRRGVPFVSNQIGYSLLDRSAEKSGLIATSNELGLTTFAYEPLAKGLLTGKYTEPENLSSPGRKYSLQQLSFYRPLTSIMKLMGALEGKGDARSITEIALGYICSKGVIPLVGLKTEGQAHDVIKAMDPTWKLSTSCVEVLDEKTDYLAKMRS